MQVKALLCAVFFGVVLIHCSSEDGGIQPGRVDSPDASTDAGADAPTAECSGASTGCKPGQACKDGHCELFCVAPQVACGETCSNLATDTANCGACGKPCEKGFVCAFGECSLSCGSLLRCVDACVDPANDPNACGGCGSPCHAGPNAVPVCTSSKCSTVCAPGFADCNGNPVDGCETNLQTSTSNCGSCGKVCGLVGVSQAACVNGVCGIGKCDGQHADCDGNPANGCEVRTYYGDPNNCGGCNKACALPHVQTSYCYNATCSVSYCTPGYADCDYQPANGCETDATTNDHCGNCYTKCQGGQQCSPNGGYYYCKCPGTQSYCGTTCVDTTSDPQNCSACGIVCGAANTSGATCAQGVCGGGTCNVGFDDCDATMSNGCESHLTNDAKHCGACGTACDPGYACSGSTCVAAPACVNNTSPKILVYHNAPPNFFNEIPAGALVQVANDAAWTSKTTSDFSAYDLIVISSCNSFDLQSAYATRQIWSPAINGRIVVDGTTGKGYNGAGIPELLTGAFSWLTTGLGTALFVADCGSRSLDFLASIGGFSSTPIYYSQMTGQVTEAAHPVMVATTDAMVSGYWYGGATITAPAGFDRLAAIPSTGKSIVFARDVLCSPP